jgi:AraC family L-rhamnose operon regulatory protein RhaS
MKEPFKLPVTEDSIRFPGYRMPLWHNPSEDFSSERGLGGRFRMVLVEDGSGVLEVNGWRGPFIAPVLLCMNETERPRLTEGRALRAQALYFHPGVVNESFDFDVIRRPKGKLSITEQQDLGWFFPFIRRSPGVFIPIPLGPASARRCVELMTTVGGLLTARSDSNWPCRSRSYFLELLMVAERAFSHAAGRKQASLSESERGVDSVVLYLHTHYHRKITLSDLTRTFNTNRTTLTRRFHKATGLTVVSYLTRLRMNVAASILRDTELDVGEIMRRVGFRDSTHFGRTFRRYIGCTPSEYRRKYCWMMRNDS